MKIEKDILLMFHGGLAPERGIETLIELLKYDQNYYLLLLGDGQTEYINSIENLANEFEVNDRFLIHSAVDINELWKYLGMADIGMVMAKGTWKSYYYMLPNKFFENIQAEVPMICSDFPAVKEIIDKYEIGITCSPYNIDEINHAIKLLIRDGKKYSELKKNLRKAKDELCWEKEKIILEKAYRRLI